MGNGFWVLIWDGWGIGLNMINPRLLTADDNRNWIAYYDEFEKIELIKQMADKHKPYYKIIE